MRENSVFSLSSVMAAVLLLAVGILLYCYHLGKTDIEKDPPARVAVYARAMNGEAAWLVPRVEGRPRFDQPPLYLWAVKLASNLSAEIKPMDARLPGAVSVILLVMLAAWWFYLHALRYGRRDEVEAPPEGFALLAGLLVAIDPTLLVLGREGLPEPMLALLCLAAAFCMGESFEARRSFYAGRSWRIWVIWAYVLAGLALLVKGPVIFILLWIPYILTARSYRLRGPDYIHAVGLVAALLVGGWWYGLVLHRFPQSLGDFWTLWTHRIIELDYVARKPVYDYLKPLLLEYFPWVLPALAMAGRVWRKKDRSPTLVFWFWSLAGNVAWIVLASKETNKALLPVMPYVALLATDGLYRWNFENRWSLAWRTLLRVLLTAALLAGLFASRLIHSDLGLALFAVLIVGWGLSLFVWPGRGMMNRPWATTVRLAVLLALAVLAGETVWLESWAPRRRLQSDVTAYFARVRERLPEGAGPLYVFDSHLVPLYEYHVDRSLVPTTNLDAVQSSAGGQTFLLARDRLDELMRKPWLVTLTTDLTEPGDTVRNAMFKVLPKTQLPANPTALDRLALRPPERLAVLGNAGTRSKRQREVGARLDRVNKPFPLDDVLLLGNNLYGPKIFDHLDFQGAFEVPYRRSLKNGVAFHALLGHEDQDYAWAQLHYPPFHMNGRRYYSLTLGGGMIDCFMLDSEAAAPGGGLPAEQIRWLEQSLAASRAPWTIVALHRALLTAAAKGRPNGALANQLLPIFDRRRVDVVCWSGGDWYERLQPRGHHPVFFNAGWSGNKDRANFTKDPALKAGVDGHAGFLLLSVQPFSLRFEAITDRGQVIDQGEISRPLRERRR